MMHSKKSVFIRARPFLNEQKMIESITDEIDENKNDSNLFFNSGRVALKFLLLNNSFKLSRKLRVGLQAFTCPVVLEAIIQSNCEPIFFDVTYATFSSNKKKIPFEEIDVLILTHLFGIPHADYELIMKECHSRGIVVIDDFAQSICLKYPDGKGFKILSDFAIYSFGFDKPVSCYKGGALSVNTSRYEKDLYSEYLKLPIEKDDVIDLKRLVLYFNLTSRKRYRGSMKHGAWYEFLLMKAIFLQSFFLNRYASYLMTRVLWIKQKSDLSLKTIQRMGRRKQMYITKIFGEIEEQKKAREKNSELAEKKCKEIGLPLIFPDNIQNTMTRLPVLVKNDNDRLLVMDFFTKHGIEVGPFNWDKLCFDDYPEFDNLKSLFPVSRDISQRILNLPIWTDEIWSAF